MLSVRSALVASHALEPKISAWAYLLSRPTFDEVTSANEITARQGALNGVAFGVKDVIDVAEMPTCSGSPHTSEATVQFDATCVAQLRDAGAIPIGKTVTAEFAYSSPGPTRNPRNVMHTPGGSSSGSAAAVAAGMVSIALGTQTGGSMIRPAAFCGVVGFKPTFGRVHRQGMDVLCDTLDTIGWFTQNVAQAVKVAEVLIPPDSSNLRTFSTDRPERIAALRCHSLAPLSPDAIAALDASMLRLQEYGARVEEPNLDDILDRLLHIQTTIMHAELARGLLPRFRANSANMSRRLADVIRQGLRISYVDYVQHQLERRQLADAMQAMLSTYDVILTPSAPGEAPRGLESTGSSALNRVWSLLGWPCLHLPTAVGSHALPIGVQCIGLPDMDHALLNWAQHTHSLLSSAQPSRIA